MHVASIFHCQDVILQVPEPLQTHENIPVSTMKLTKAIWNKILDYRDTVQAVSVMADDEVSFVNNTFHCGYKLFSLWSTSQTCTHKWPLVHLTINFKNYFLKVLIILKTKQLQKNKNMDSYQSQLLSSKHNSTKDTFTLWYDTIICKVEERISYLMVKFKFHQTKFIFQDKEVLDCLNDLHEEFTVVSIGKACNNVQKIHLKVGTKDDHSNTHHF